MTFEWDEDKNKLNEKKHKLSFKIALTAFYDEYAIRYPDPDHSHDEERFVLLGKSEYKNILVVVFCYREVNEAIRIISARKATKKERKNYEEYWL